MFSKFIEHIETLWKQLWHISLENLLANYSARIANSHLAERWLITFALIEFWWEWDEMVGVKVSSTEGTVVGTMSTVLEEPKYESKSLWRNKTLKRCLDKYIRNAKGSEASCILCVQKQGSGYWWAKWEEIKEYLSFLTVQLVVEPVLTSDFPALPASDLILSFSYGPLQRPKACTRHRW